MNRVVIIGAGISGLATADLLERAGISSITLEARTRVGGRLSSDEHGVDRGASWFWPGERRVAALVERFGVAIHHQHLDGDAMYDDVARTVRLDGNPIDVMSSRFTDGADSLATALEASLRRGTKSDIRLGSHVHHVDVHESGVNVSIEFDRSGKGGETFQADHVVVALPPALAAASISITPGLPQVERLVIEHTPVWMGAITKVVARYATAFWRDSGLSGAAISHRGPMREIHDLSGPGGQPAALFGFASTTSDSGPVLRGEVIAQLVRLFGPHAAEPVGLEFTDWRTERFTSPPGVEHMNDYSTFGHRSYQQPMLAGRLHWVSTETAPVAAGHIEGALAAAQRTADQIISSYASGASS